jgi:N-acetyl sugar amidotransferase
MTVRFCKRCVISDQRPNSCVEHANHGQAKTFIHFDEEGVCDACRVAESKRSIDWEQRERELLALLEQHRSRDGHYDCVLPGSGGKDSFYAAHILRTRYGMHPILVTWAAHIYTAWGWRNLQRWQAIANHVLVTPQTTTHRLLTRLAVENLFHPFQPFIIGQKVMAPKLAAQFGIPLVFYGESEAEYGNPIDETATARRSRDYHSLGGDLYVGGVSVRDLQRTYGLCAADLEPYLPARAEDLERVGVEVHYLGYYLKWRPQECYYYACEHGGFEASPERTPGTYSKYSSIDDKVDDLHYWSTYVKFGIGRATYDAAQEIRSGEITREDGVALVKRFDGEWPARFENELMEYLSVPGFPKMTKESFIAMADRFRPPHLWDKKGDGTWRLKNVVWNSSGEK